MCQTWWFVPIIQALGRWRQGVLKFKVILGHIVRSCLKQINKETPSTMCDIHVRLPLRTALHPDFPFLTIRI